ncbi:hypothetical protein BDZ45DRAFT_365136 [Acephala macrosclerotiorum]|nr:hypothetical protein BDZ45DRAFT_365136 [Acephala macrosclerotiorum]
MPTEDLIGREGTITSLSLTSHLDGMKDRHRLFRMSDQTGLAQYLCDHCKQRKLKCSRDIPVCQNCKSWNGGCVYSRHGKIRRRPRSKLSSYVGLPSQADQPSPVSPDEVLAKLGS